MSHRVVERDRPLQLEPQTEATLCGLVASTRCECYHLWFCSLSVHPLVGSPRIFCKELSRGRLSTLLADERVC
jgi:hypothetical protein